MDRMPAVDRALLRAATYELIVELDVPTAVVIDEAIELAKEYSTEDSGRFLNGVLASIAAEVRSALRDRPPRGGKRRRRAYEAAGVDYETLDAAKREAIEAAASTLRLPETRGASVVAGSLGEPATLVEIGSLRLAVVLECLGTKVRDRPQPRDAPLLRPMPSIGIDAVAAIVNDLACVGALPLAVNAYFATGSSSWYSGPRHRSLVAGWRQACEAVGAAWVGASRPRCRMSSTPSRSTSPARPSGGSGRPAGVARGQPAARG